MKHRLRGLGLALVAAAALTPHPASIHAQSPAAAPSASGAPVYGRFGVDTAGMDRSVHPGDDFYAYANGGWTTATAIPADRSTWGMVGILVDRAEERTRSLVEEAAAQPAAPGSTARKVGDYYAAFMDESAVDALGTAPLEPYLDYIDAIADPAGLARAIGVANRLGINAPIRIDVDVDLKTNDRYAVYLAQGGLGLPDRDYYLQDSNARFAEARTKYQQHVAAMLRLAGIGDADARAARIVALERKLAEAHWTRVESRQMDRIYNPVTRAELAARFPGIDWNAFTGGAELPADAPIVIMQPSAIEQTAALVAAEPLPVWKDYATFRVISAYASVLPKRFVDEDFAFNGQVLQGTPQIRDRWRRGVDQLNRGLGEAVGQLYVARYFPPEAKTKADELVRNLIAAMDARLQNLTWMSAETKVKARAKLAAFTPKIGYPDTWRDYSALVVSRSDAFGNLQHAREFEFQRNVNKIGTAVDRGEWFMTPQTVNAYANPTMNEVVFPAAILQPPFFDPNADPAVNYGAIGMVIGHEISHHFDDQGRKFDPAGSLSEWWTPGDVERFTSLTNQVVKQYGSYEPIPGSPINGALTLGENLADLAGLNVAYDAYRLSLGGQTAPVIDGFTGDQRFFLGFAQVWRYKYREAALVREITTDGHTPGHYRPTVARNLDAWYAAFNVQPGRKLYLPPADRIRVW